ncbi:MAG: hypothetical protein E6Q25_01900 [Acinetobacter sp.]|jgi:hypothetical protein|nr:MAG: hypothetical protein E6Q25_01900 [Acinetobacter sp.]
MKNSTQYLIDRIGATDQLYLTKNSAELGLERADLRLQLVRLSQLKAEQLYFLQEAIVLLEQARVEFEDISLNLYLDLSLSLAEAYMLHFEITQQIHFALITQQILKPLAHYHHADIYFALAYASVSKNETALTRHWLTKYATTIDFNLERLQQHHAFNPVRQLDWFRQLLKNKVH